MSAEGDKLFELLKEEELQPGQTEQQIPAFSAEVKDEVAARVLAKSPPDPGLLARLNLIRTPTNAARLDAAYLANLSASSPVARHASLGELARRGHAKALDAEMAAAMDGDDRVAALACGLLVPRKSDPAVLGRLQEVAGARKGDGAFPMTTSILEAAGIKAPFVVAATDGGGADGG